jgi:hypothetical protein
VSERHQHEGGTAHPTTLQKPQAGSPQPGSGLWRQPSGNQIAVKNQRTLGIVVALVSAVNFAIANTLAGVAYEGGSDPLALSTTRCILPTLLVFVIL